MNIIQRALWVISALAFSQAASANLIVNPSFEDDAIGAGTFQIFNTGITGWYATSPNGIEIQNNVAGAPAPGAGNQFVELDVRANSGMAQDVPTVAGGVYALSFLISPRPGLPGASNPISVFWNNLLLATVGQQPGGATTNWSDVNAFGLMGNAGTTQLRFEAAGTSDGRGGYIDLVSLVRIDVPPMPVSEPSPLLLSLFGLLGLALARTRRT